MKTIKLKEPAKDNTLDAQLMRETGIGYCWRWEFKGESTLYCEEIDTIAYWYESLDTDCLSKVSRLAASEDYVLLVGSEIIDSVIGETIRFESGLKMQNGDIDWSQLCIMEFSKKTLEDF